MSFPPPLSSCCWPEPLLPCARGVQQGARSWSSGREEQSNPSEVELTQEQRCPRDLAQPMPLHKPCSDWKLPLGSGLCPQPSQNFTAIIGGNNSALTTFSSFIVLFLCTGHWGREILKLPAVPTHLECLRREAGKSKKIMGFSGKNMIPSCSCSMTTGWCQRAQGSGAKPEQILRNEAGGPSPPGAEHQLNTQGHPNPHNKR